MKMDLVKVDKYSGQIRKLPVLQRVSIDYPLLVRDGVAKKLARVAKRLPNDLYLQVASGYRTRRTQENLWNNNPNRGLVFDPSEGIPPHTTGGAVDVFLVDRDDREINLSDPGEKYYFEPQLYSKKITKRAQELRLLLNKLMTGEGFAALDREYWHFSYGDKMWAEMYRKRILYRELDLPKSEWYSWWRRMWGRVLLKLNK